MEKENVNKLLSLMMGIGGMSNNPYNDFLIFGDKLNVELYNFFLSLLLSNSSFFFI